MNGYNSRIGASLAKLLQPRSDLGRAQPHIALQLIESLLSPTFTEQEGTELDYKEMQPVHPKGNQSWVFIGRTDVEAETNTSAT